MHVTNFASSVKSRLDRTGSDIRKRFKILLFFFPNLCQCSSTFPSAALHKSALGKAAENDSSGDTG